MVPYLIFLNCPGASARVFLRWHRGCLSGRGGDVATCSVITGGDVGCVLTGELVQFVFWNFFRQLSEARRCGGGGKLLRCEIVALFVCFRICDEVFCFSALLSSLLVGDDIFKRVAMLVTGCSICLLSCLSQNKTGVTPK